MRHDCCETCFYWDYINDTSESNAKICYFEFGNCTDYPPEFLPACLSSEKYPEKK